MELRKGWLAALVVILSLSGVAASADPAEEAYREGVSAFGKQDYDAAIRSFTDALRQNPQHANAYVYRGCAYYQKGDPGKAIADLTEAIRLDPTLVGAFRARAGAYSARGEFDKAIADYTQALRLDPQSAQFYYLLRGEAYLSKGDYDKAIADYSQAIRLQPKLAACYYGRAVAYGAKRQYDRLLADCAEAIRLNPKYSGAYLVRGQAYQDMRQYAQAIADYTEAVRLSPDYLPCRNNLAWLLATCPEASFRDGKRAIEHATRACELTQWKVCDCLDTLAAAYAEVGKFDKAIELAQKASDLAATPARREIYQSHLKLYRDGKPYRERVESLTASLIEHVQGQRRTTNSPPGRRTRSYFPASNNSATARSISPSSMGGPSPAKVLRSTPRRS